MLSVECVSNVVSVASVPCVPCVVYVCQVPSVFYDVFYERYADELLG